MNWWLVFRLSLFGLAMAGATVTLIPPDVEPVFWLAILAVSVYVVGTRCSRRVFTHGVAVGAANGVWVTAAHVAFASTYLAHHPQEAALMASMEMPTNPVIAMLIVGPVIGVGTGMIIGVGAVAVAAWQRAHR